MKWTLVVLVLGTQPVHTGLIFDSLDTCYAAEEEMRAEYAKSYNKWREWAEKNKAKSGFPKSDEMMQKRLSVGVCIPHL